MEQILTYNSIQVYNNYDPTRTTELRNLFARDLKRRFVELERVIVRAIVERDCFGLNRSNVLQIDQMVPPYFESFAFARSADKIKAFMDWLQEQIDMGLLEIRELEQIGRAIEEAWLNKYIYDSYKRGIIRARQELRRAGYDVPTIDESGGIGIIMGTPFHLDRVGLLFTRIFSDLKGITQEMDMQISRVLAQGMIDGDGPQLLARKLVSAINGDGVDRLGITDTLGRFIPAWRRAEMLARTEVIRAHHLATIQEYRNWGVLGITVKAEWRTAGDDRVCERCNALEGRVFALDEVESLIPIHPQCRCICLPLVISVTKVEQ